MSVYDLIKAERERQISIYGHPPLSSFEYLAILIEEVGEVGRALTSPLDSFYGGVPNDKSDVKTELIQVAAVAIAMYERLEVDIDDRAFRFDVKRESHA